MVAVAGARCISTGESVVLLPKTPVITQTERLSTASLTTPRAQPIFIQRKRVHRINETGRKYGTYRTYENVYKGGSDQRCRIANCLQEERCIEKVVLGESFL